MPFLQLKPQVGFGLVAGRPIFLDLGRDRYFALGEPASAAFERLRQDPAELAPDDPGLRGLLATGLFLTAGTPQAFAAASFLEPARAFTSRPVRPRILDVIEAWQLLHSVRYGLSRHRLSRMVAALGTSAKARVPDPEPALPFELIGRFLAARTLVPITPSCLLDSLALGRWLRRRSTRPALVFGVKLDPFAAHCWLQAGDLLLNDAPDRVAEFTPILVV